MASKSIKKRLKASKRHQKFDCHAARFLDCVDQPSISSPLLPTFSPSTLMPFMPGVSSSQPWAAIPPALARLSGISSSMGVKNAEMRLASSSLKWYFSRSTSGRAQWRRRWILRSSPRRLKISCDHFPVRHVRGKGPSSSIICAT